MLSDFIEYSNNVKSEDSVKLESDIKMWSTKYEEERKKAEELGSQVKAMEQEVEDYKYRLSSLKSIETSNNQYLDEEIKV